MANQESQLVRVTWLDSVLVDRYVPEEDRPLEPSLLDTVGFLVEEQRDCLVIARETQHNDVWRGLIVIPTFAIKTLVYLKEA